VSGAVVWITGLPASGKSTLAGKLATRLREAKRAVLILDSDEVRAALVPSPGYDEAGRDGFYATLAGLAALVARQGLIAIVPATGHRRTWRERARALAPRFLEVHVATPLVECRRRDPKGLYARAAELPDLPGADIPYEPPLAPDVVAAEGGNASTVDAILALLEIGGIRDT
jgi:adenylylsulfate kinase